MKQQYTIFYSWMSDRPNEQNRKYIRKVLDKDTKKLEKKFGVKILIDSDSRGEDGLKSIDETVLKKIGGCDLFVGDITPVLPRYKWIGYKKPVLNSNVMYELGFAVSTLGWNRCIMVWNSKYGNVRYAPFDIRNHTTVTYKKGKRELSLYEVLKNKIQNYDQYVKEWRTAKERSFDAEKYYNITQICSERNLIDSIDGFLTNRVYNALEFDWWDKLIYYYNHYPENRFVDEEIHQAYIVFLSKLQEMVWVACRHNVQSSYSYPEGLDVSSDEWKKLQTYKIRDPYETLTEDRAFELEQKIDAEFASLVPSLMDSYNCFRNLIRSKLLI